jgi:serine/threonine protein kinase/tetratricopeptide (TPR) repeat protein
MPMLDPTRWQALSPHLDAAFEVTGLERERWLVALEERDPRLAADLRLLLAEHDELDKEGFLSAPPPHPTDPAISRPTHAVTESGEFDSERLKGSRRNRLAGSPARKHFLKDIGSVSLIGQTVGAYTIVAPIGQGGMGSVWLAKRSDGRFEGFAAVKFLNAALLGRKGEERFRREGTIVARLSHPSIAHLIDAGVSSAGQPYLILEYVQGVHIDQYCDNNRLDLHGRIKLFLDVLTAVAHAHANLVIHRDIKPSNVLVRTHDTDRVGSVTLLDFGIAKLIERDGDTDPQALLTQESRWAMTPAFAAPEQLTGGAVTTATDVYALGVLLYMLLGGQHPAGAGTKSPAELIAFVVNVEAPRLSDALTRTKTAGGDDALTTMAANRSTSLDRLRRTLRGDLETIVATALKKDPRERYPTVLALADDLQRYLDRRPIRARPDTLMYRTKTFVRRHLTAVVTTAVFACTVAGLIAFYTLQLAAERDRAQLEASKAARMTAFMTGLLTAADPYADRARPGEPTVRELLDAGAARVDRELAGRPELQADIMTVIGRVYERLNLLDKAQPLLERALARAREADGPNSVRVAQSLNDLGVLMRRVDFEKSDALLKESLAMRRQLLGNEDAKVAVTLVELSRTYRDRARGDDAEPLLREALAIRRKVHGNVHRETATSLSDLGHLLRDRGELAEAEAMYRENTAITRKVHVADHPDLATSLTNLATVRQLRGDNVTAEQLHREALAIYAKGLGESHVRYGATLNNLSYALLGQGRLDDAEAVIRKSLPIVRATRGDNHPETASVMLNLGRVELQRGRLKEAEALLAHGLKIRQDAYLPDDRRVAVAGTWLGAVYTATGRHADAERLLLEAHRHLAATPAAYASDKRVLLTHLIALYESWGKPDQAAPYRAELAALKVAMQ